jgi:hypothetical protein
MVSIRQELRRSKMKMDGAGIRNSGTAMRFPAENRIAWN